MRPELGRTMPMQLSSVVVLPAPLRPSRPKIDPAPTEKLIPSTATTSPKRLTSVSTRIVSSVCISYRTWFEVAPREPAKAARCSYAG